MTTLVRDVTDVTWKLNKSNPPILVIDAVGGVGTPNWKSVKLSAISKVAPPADGIQEFNFVGDPPAGIQIQLESIVNGSAELVPPKWLKGVRVIAEKNNIVVMLDA